MWQCERCDNKHEDIRIITFLSTRFLAILLLAKEEPLVKKKERKKKRLKKKKKRQLKLKLFDSTYLFSYYHQITCSVTQISIRYQEFVHIIKDFLSTTMRHTGSYITFILD